MTAEQKFMSKAFKAAPRPSVWDGVRRAAEIVIYPVVFIVTVFVVVKAVEENK